MAQTRIDLRRQATNADFSGTTPTRPFQTGTSLPATCSAGDTFFKTDAAAGANLYLCAPSNTWTATGGASPLPAVAGNGGKALTTDGSNVGWSSLSGDVSGSLTGLSVTGIQGRKIANIAPGSQNALVWNASAGQWEPGTVAISNYAVDFSSQTRVSITHDSHGMNSANLLVECYAGGGGDRVEPDTVVVDPATFDVVVSFAVAQTGRCVISGAGGPGGAAAGAGLASLDSGPGLVLSQAGSSTTVSLDTAAVPTFLTISTVLTFDPILPGACVEKRFALNGAATGDAVAPGWPAGLPDSLGASMRVSAANEVAARLCNQGVAAVGGWSDTYRASILRSF